MNNETDIGIKFTASVNGNKKLQELATSIATIKAAADGLDTGVINSIQTSADATKEMSKQTTTMANTMKLAFNFSTVRMFARTLGKVTKELTRMANLSSEYLENVNLFQVAFDGNYRSAERFINKISEMYGLDESRITRVVGIFKQLANAMNVSAETGEKLATLMTQMSLDISSLYNVDFERATSVLQSAFSGQTKPIRGTTGADITQSTLQTTLNGLGIDKLVSDLTFAEKRLLIIISLTQQLKEATNDLGRTIESPANQLKVLSEQWQRLSRALGNTFLPILAKILPYLNAILMVLTEIINMIAKLFGYKSEDYDYFSGTSDAVMDLEDSLGKATAGAGKLKNALSGLRNFDRLNVISSPSSGGSSGGGAGGTGIDPSILKAFNNAFDSYQDKLENVRMKASKIRDAIMEWLGFTKEIDPETGKIIWKYQGLTTTLKNILKWFKDLNPLAKILVGYIGYLIGKKVISALQTIFGLLSKSKVGTVLATMATQFKKIATYVSTWTSAMGNRKDGLIMGIQSWDKEVTRAERLQTALGGLITTGLGLYAINTSMKDLSENGLTLANTLGLVVGNLSSIFGGVMTGISLTGSVWGGVVGGIITGVGSLITAWLSYETEEEKMVRKSEESLKKVQKTTDEIKKQVADTELELMSNLAMPEYHERLLSELESIVDENGKVKDGYEERAKYITTELAQAYGVEYELENGVYKKVGETNEEVKKRIKLKEQEIVLEAYKEDYIEALKNEKRLYGEMKSQEADRKKFYDEQNEKLGLFAEKIGYQKFTLEELMAVQDKVDKKVKLSAEEQEKANFIILSGYKSTIQAAKNYDDAYKLATDNYMSNTELRLKYSDLKTAIEIGDLEAVEKAVNELTSTYIVDGKAVTMSEDEQINERIARRESELQIWKRNNDDRYKQYKDTLTNIDTYTKGVTPEIAEKWAALGRTSSDDFITEFSKLDENLQKDVISKMYENGFEINSELQKGLDAFDISKQIKLGVNDTEAVKKFNKIFGENGSIGKILSKVGIKIPTITLATGGLPQVGQLFVANEKGPELIGQIGGQSFVANQNQVVDLIDRKLSNVNSNKGQQVYNIYLDEYHKIGTYTLEQLESMSKTNGKPIQIG